MTPDPTRPEPVVLTRRQRELIRLALYDYQTTDWAKVEVNEVLNLFRGSEVHVYQPEVEP